MQNVANLGIFLSFAVYFMSALFGYLTFYGMHSEKEGVVVPLNLNGTPVL